MWGGRPQRGCLYGWLSTVSSVEALLLRFCPQTSHCHSSFATFAKIWKPSIEVQPTSCALPLKERTDRSFHKCCRMTWFYDVATQNVLIGRSAWLCHSGHNLFKLILIAERLMMSAVIQLCSIILKGLNNILVDMLIRFFLQRVRWEEWWYGRYKATTSR